MLINQSLHQQIEDLFQQYLTLSEDIQAIIKILAVIYKPVGAGKFNELLKELQRAGIFNTQPSIKPLSKEQKQHLVQLGFITNDKMGLRINLLLANRLTQISIEEDSYKSILHYGEKVVPVASTLEWQNKQINEQRIFRDMYFLGSLEQLESVLEFNKNPQIINVDKNQLLVHLFFIPFNLDTFLKLPNSIQYQSFATWLIAKKDAGVECDYICQLMRQVINHNPSNQALQHLLAETLLLRGDIYACQQLLTDDDPSCWGLQLRASMQFLQGQFANALQTFELAFKAKNKISRRKKQYLSGPLGLFYKLCLVIQANQQDGSLYEKVLKQIDYEEDDYRNMSRGWAAVNHSLMRGIICLSNGNKYSDRQGAYNNRLTQYKLAESVVLLTNSLLAYWVNQELSTSERAELDNSLAQFNQLGFELYATFAKQLINTLDNQQVYALPSNVLNLPEQISPQADWDIALDKLLALNPGKSATATPTEPVAAKPMRMIWELHEDFEGYRIKPREQKATRKGWGKGRNVALKRLYQDASQFDYLTEQDLKLCRAIEAYQGWGYHSSTEYSLSGLSALQAAIGHENLYLADDLSAPIELQQKEPELLVSQQGDQYCLSIADLPETYTELNNDENFTLREDSPERWHLTVFSTEHMRVANIIGDCGLLVPSSAKEKVLASISAIAPFLNIQSDISELDTGLESVTCDSDLVINIQPYQSGLEFTCLVMPFGEQGPAFKPGIGNANMTTELNGQRIATQRDLQAEEQLLDQLDQYCPAFLTMYDNSLALEDLPQALEALQQLEQIATQENNPIALKLRWPKGKKFSLSKPLESQHLQLKVGKSTEWFDLSGELQISEEQVIDFRQLLKLVASSNGRFIQLDESQIIALSDDLRAKLEQLNHATDEGRFHQLASGQILEATQGMRLKPLHSWEKQTQKMHQANEINPQVPSTLQAELRDYQLEGFDWASRLAHWGAGACLADDMGLGKTLQALAVILSRASQGATLVIAPTSVCFNWQQEAHKFAPTLNVKMFAEATTGEQREQLLDNLAPFDLVIISYGLLLRESDKLKQIKWQTIIADEAQALKNPLAKRTQAACALKADFRMITTGTPIENNLTELWSLFRFVNPGLLGNLKQFGARFAFPIENVKEDKIAARKASQGLKTLIQPFILRRMKNQVLTELPPRTEINIAIELSDKEKAFYEALRLNAIDNLMAASDTANAGEQRIKMLAELVKLRQACCHPKLVMAESDLPSAKLAALDELVQELKQNKHKALIFSQFVGHLQLIKQHLDQTGISYQYLDGSTPQKERAKRVNAFQNGEGDVFLISLKAGGSGLNLTAADYVIHMDPWWNPAVEEQASDRAHRMGQQRPVTIYRLISKNTIEERIVALHQHKRDLADQLLAGNDQVSKLSVEEMLGLLKEEF
ncbi:DEAD/DEAH box helicase [Saccharobesus litoralis]|nr:DEAD/DEAH box helicase [Saccharobesus litoralis]